jgi:hypothetical protein
VKADVIAVGQRVVIGGDGKRIWRAYTGTMGTVREIKDDPSCAWPYAVCTDTGVWLNVRADEIEPAPTATAGTEGAGERLRPGEPNGSGGRRRADECF